jgi:hypothetical protein
MISAVAPTASLVAPVTAGSIRATLCSGGWLAAEGQHAEVDRDAITGEHMGDQRLHRTRHPERHHHADGAANDAATRLSTSSSATSRPLLAPSAARTVR